MCGRRRPSDGARGRLAGRPSGILTGSTPMSACLPDPAPAGYTSTRVVSDFRLGGVRMGMDDHGGMERAEMITIKKSKCNLY